MINKEYTYKYTFKPIAKKVVYENNIPVIYYNGEKRLLQELVDFCISSEVKLTRLEACELVKGTIGWELYHGEFKEDELSNDKYYQPNISEFCVGFEWEYHNALGKDFGKWTKEVVKNDASLFHVNSLLATGAIRVKYLDKQDIEDCEFEIYKTHAGTSTREFESKDSRYFITFDPNFGSSWNITITDEVDFIFFHGHLNNKSELKKLLKQLGI